HRSETEIPFGMALEPMARPCLTMLLQYPNDLLFGETAAFHVLVLMLSQNELQTGLSPWGNVTLAGLAAIFGRLEASAKIG
ncbi:MAG: hypothetical protein WAT78_05875, partial [Rhizobiaceae bacterium]